MNCISISHKNTPADVREQFAFSDKDCEAFLEKVKTLPGVTGCVLLMTCNRSEFYFSGAKSCYQNMEECIAEWKGCSTDLLRKYSLNYEEGGCIRHLYQVSCGMHSMVLGEVEIIRQVKDAYRLAGQADSTGSELNMVFQGALGTAKDMAANTLMTRLPISVGTLCAKEAVSYCADRKHPCVLVIGATGRTGSIVAKDICQADGRIEVLGTVRKHKGNYGIPGYGNLHGIHQGAGYGNGESIANGILQGNPGIRLVDYSDRYAYLSRADVVISATSSPHYTLVEDEVRRAVSGKDKPRLFLDLAVPRDIDVGIEEIPGVERKDIDYMNALAENNNALRLSEMKKIEILIEERVDEMQRMLAFHRFRANHGEVLDRLKERDGTWLLYKLRDSMDAEGFLQILEKIKRL